MKKKKEVKKSGVKIYSTEFQGYISEMPQEAKDALVLRNPKAAKLFEVKQ